MTDTVHWLAGGVAAAAVAVVGVPYAFAVGLRLADALDLTEEPYDPTQSPFPARAVDAGACAVLAAAVGGVAAFFVWLLKVFPAGA